MWLIESLGSIKGETIPYDPVHYMYQIVDGVIATCAITASTNALQAPK